MRGYVIDVTAITDKDGNPYDMFDAGLLMNVYDNGEQVLHDVGALTFEFLTPDVYVGEHILTMTYYRENLPEVESTPIQFYKANFTLPTLTLEFTVELLS